MSIGTSIGGWYEDEADHAMKTMSGKDNNIIDPEQTPDIGTQDQNVETKPQPQAEVIPVGERYQTWPERMVRSAGEALTLPGDVYAGKINPLSQEGIERATDLAGVMVVGPRPGTVGSGITAKGPETIKSAAMKYKGEIFENQNHGMAFNDIMDKYPTEMSWHDIKDGFTTTHGRFISREEAFQLAAQKSQIDPKVMRAYKADDHGKFITHEGDEPMLLSEDLQ